MASSVGFRLVGSVLCLPACRRTVRVGKVRITEWPRRRLVGLACHRPPDRRLGLPAGRRRTTDGKNRAALVVLSLPVHYRARQHDAHPERAPETYEWEMPHRRLGIRVFIPASPMTKFWAISA